MPDARPTDPVAAAGAYDASLVPALMQEWAPRLAAAARVGRGDHVLDVACGTGVLTREVAHYAGPAGSATGLDLDPGMLTVARTLSRDLRWLHGSAEELPFADASFDVVVSQFGLMFVPDRPRALSEPTRRRYSRTLDAAGCRRTTPSRPAPGSSALQRTPRRMPPLAGR